MSQPVTLFVFSGMGPQWPGMGRGLFEEEPVYRRTLREIDALFQPRAGFSLIDLLAEGEENGGVWPCRFAQPANFALQIGLARLLESRGVTPDLCLGHSTGEVPAALVSGHLSLEQALDVCWARSELQNQRSGKGGMLAVKMTESEARALCGRTPGVELAAINGKVSMTLAGSDAALTALAADLRDQGVTRRRLRGDIAYHSTDMDPIRALLLARLAHLTPRPPDVPLISSVTGKYVSGRGADTMDAAYWWRNVREPVRFRAALDTALDMGVSHCVEIGPKPVLRNAIREAVEDGGHGVSVLPTLDGGEDERGAIRTTLERFRSGEIIGAHGL